LNIRVLGVLRRGSTHSIGLVGINDRVPDSVRTRLEQVVAGVRANDQLDVPQPIG
jgi:hypothetical protein